jgi:eukaryotic-like serine/threonine-protein kinase
VTDGERAARAHAIFSTVLDEPADRRGPLLDRLCAGDPALRDWVDGLLRAEATADSILDAGLADLSAVLLDDADPAGRRVGPYRVVRELGQGGMGRVFLAERDDGEFHHRVALKVIREGPDADALADRFRRERQILASLQHPNIAQLHDGGRSPEGYPFLAMEYVEGERIDRHADHHRLGIEDRLRLFLTACAAVDHAHRNLVVHRDLKPAHILVNADGVVKLLDFGIAKLLTPGEQAEDRTRTALHAFTPRYSSPEQIRRGTVTTASDVYALGVILYELIAGRTPFPDTDDPFEATRARLEDDPPPPSAVAPPGLRRRLQGDLDAIVLRAMKKDPGERYPNAALLAQDLTRWLRHEPVTARPDGPLYRAPKFARRHRTGVAVAAVLLALPPVFAAFHVARVTGERDRAGLEARKAAEVRDFLLGLFTSGYPHRALGDTLRVADLLERGVARADSLDGQPELRALLLVTLGDVYRELARYDRADSLLASALAIYRALPRAQPLDLAGALWSSALLQFDLQRYDDAIRLTREALAIQRRELGEEHPDVITALNNLASGLANSGQVEEALELHAQVLRLRRRVLGPDHPAAAVTLNNIGTLLYRQARYAEAEPYLVEALELRRRALEPSHPDVALSLNNLAGLYRQQGRLDEAEPLLREALATRRQVLGEDHPRVAVSSFSLGRLLQMRGELYEAEPYLLAALEIDRRAYGPDHPEVGVDAYQLGTLLAQRGDCQAAAPVLAEAVAIFERHARHEQLASARAALEACTDAAASPPRPQ